jgi:hypothetical protein
MKELPIVMLSIALLLMHQLSKNQHESLYVVVINIVNHNIIVFIITKIIIKENVFIVITRYVILHYNYIHCNIY